MNRQSVVFLSSTYFDLKKERSLAIRHIIKNHYVFSGMEAFFTLPMTEQWESIKRTIRECDIYVAVLGERYGCVIYEGKSCTELECEYAAKIGKPIIALIEDRGVRLSFGPRQSREDREKQARFKENIKCDYKYYWKDQTELITNMFKGIHRVECERTVVGVGRPLFWEQQIERTPTVLRITMEYSDNCTEWSKEKKVYEDVYRYDSDALRDSVCRLAVDERLSAEVALYCFVKRLYMQRHAGEDIVVNAFYINQHDLQNALEIMNLEREYLPK